jgi:hypothetical protein
MVMDLIMDIGLVIIVVTVIMIGIVGLNNL